jgi:hypothetical protein
MNSLEKEFVPYEQALALKELGFDEPCLMRIWWLNSVHKDTIIPFEPHISINGRDINFEYSLPKKHPSTEFVALELQVPTFSQAFRWFRKNHKLGAIVSQFGYGIEDEYGQIIYNIDDDEKPLCYEEAELACLIKLIGIVKEKKNG